MKELKNKKLALFFSCGISLKMWESAGNLSREIRPYIELARYLDEIYFFTYGDTTDSQYYKLFPKNIRIFPRRFGLPSKSYSLFLPLFYRKELKSVDFLKTNQMSGAWVAVLAKWLYKKKLILRCGYEWLLLSERLNKSTWKRKIIYLVEKVAYKTADKIILTSKEDKKFVTKRFRINPEKIEIIPNYIDVDLFKILNVPKEKNRIIFVGRLEEEKNLFNLIEAIANIPVKLVLIGSGSLKQKLKEFSKEQKANVEFKENIANEKLPEDLNKSEIFILPSFYEGCPKTLLEAMSCGLAVIGTKVAGVKEIIKHKVNGYLCAANSESIRKAICEVLEDNALREKIGQNARKTILENFSLERILEKEVEIYKSL